MSAASLATSVPVTPMATPMSAFLRAGESFTPSPVTATISPICWRFSTTRSFCSGAMREKTTSPARASLSSSSLMRSSSTPETTLGRSPWTMPILRATETAVSP